MTDFDLTTREGRDSIAQHLRQVAFEAGMICHPESADSKITWANESGSVYLALPGCRKVRIADHGAAYGCSISVSPDEMSVEDAVKWIKSEAAADAADAEDDMTVEEINALYEASKQ